MKILSKIKFVHTLIAFVILILSVENKGYGQCVAGSNSITWNAAGSGTQTVIPTYSTAGGPPAAVTDQVTGCTNAGSISSFNFTTTITEVNGTVYDRIRSGTDGIYGNQVLSITLDNADGGGGSSSYSPGNTVNANFTFDYPVILNDLTVVDMDYVSGSPFQDKITVTAKDIYGNNVPVTLELYANTYISLSGTNNQTAIATTNNGLSETDQRGWVTIKSSTAIKSIDILYEAGPQIANPTQQAIGITTFDFCCPSIIDIAGSVRNDCEINGSGSLISSLSGSQLYAILVNTTTGKVVASQAISGGNYNFTNQIGNQPYQVLLRTQPGTVGNNPPTQGIPSSWAHVTEADGSPNGSINIAATTSDVSGRNFGVRGTAYPTAVPSTNSPVCLGGTINFNETGINGVNYSWSGPNGFSSGSRTPSITNASSAASGVYTVTVGNNFGCSVTATTSVSISALPNAAANSNSPVCLGQTINLTSSGGSSYNWSGPNSFSSTSQNPSRSIATSGMAGIYTVTVTNAAGCTSTATTNVVLNSLPNATASSNSAVCVGQSINLTSSGGTGYSWAGPNSFSSTSQNPSRNNATTAMAGTYTVTVTNANGCTSTATTAVVVNNLPVATAGSNSPICAGETLNLTSSGGTSYSWAGPLGYSSSMQNPSRNSASVLMSGTYTVTVTNANGCTSTATTSVTVNALPSPNPTASSNTPVCVGETINLSTSLNAGYSWSGPAGFNSSAQNPSRTNATVAMAGTYTVTVSNISGCTATATTAVVVNDLPVATAASNSPVCVGQTINLTSSGGSSYNWSGPNSFSSTSQNPSRTNATTAMSGVYTVTVTNASGCTSTATTSATVNALPTPTAGNDGPVCAGTTLNLTSTGGTSYSWSGPAGFSSAVQNPSRTNATPAMSGVYTVTVTNASGCTSTATTSATVNALPTPTAGNDGPVCAGTTLNLTSIGGTSYSWSGPAGFSSAVQNPSRTNATTAMSGVYTVTVTNASGCTSTATTSATVNALPTPTAGNDGPVCAGTTLNLTSTGGTSYSWSGPAGFSSAVQNPSRTNATPAMSGVYTVTVTNASGCTSTATTSATVNALPTPTAGNDGPVCAGTTLNLTSTGGTSYSWSGPAGFSSAVQNPSRTNATTAMSGVYTVTVTNASGCTSTATTSATVNALPTPTAGNDGPVCAGTTLNLTSTGGTSYSWSGPAGFSSAVQNPSRTNATPAMSGVYTVTVTNASGCSSTATTSATVNALPTPTAGNDGPVCAGTTLNLTSTGGTSYSWSGPAGFSSAVQNPSRTNATPAMSGVYTVTVTNASGCTSTATTSATVNALPTPTAGNDGPVCAGTTLNLTSTGGTSYSWSGPAGFSSAVQNPSRTNATTAMSGVYTVTVTNASGCTSTATTSATVNALPTPTAGNDGPVCAGTTLNLTSTGGTSYSWSGPAGFSSAVQNPSRTNATPAMSGVYTVTVTNASGCTSTATTSATVNALPTPTAGNDGPVCAGTTLNLTSTGGTSYSWSGPAGFSSAVQNPSRTNATPAMSGVYTVTVTNASGCTSTATTSATVNALPTPTAGNDGPVCAGTTLNLTSIGGTSYSWSGPAGFSSAVQNPSRTNATPAMSGVYTVTVTNASGCTSTATTSATVNALPTPTAGNDGPVCAGTTLNLTSTGGTSYSWSGPAGFSSAVQNPSRTNATPAMSGVYTVTVTNASGCTSTATTSATVNALPTPTAGNDGPVCAGTTLNLTSIGGTSYSWSGPAGFSSAVQNPSRTNATTAMSGVYTVTVTNASGCTSTATTSATVNALPTPTAGNDGPVCAGTTLNLTSTGGTSYSWSGPAGFSSAVQNPSRTNATPAMSGVYTVTVTNASGCTSTATTSATVNALPTISSTSTSVNCNGGNDGSITVNHLTGSSPYTYIWSTSPSQTSQTATGLEAGTYSVLVTDANGCSATISTTVNQPDLVVVSASPTAALCKGANGSAALSATGGNSIYTFSSSGGSVSGSTLTAGAGTYTITATDGNGCTGTTTVTITEPDSYVTASAADYTLACFETTGDIILTVSQGTSPYTYDWNNDGTGDFDDAKDLIGVPEGTYTVTLRDANGCETTASASVIFTPCPEIQIVKEVDKATISEPELLTYTISLNNTGNIPLTSINLTDDLAGTATLISGDLNSNSELDTNEVWVYTATYSATQSDIDDGSNLINIASVTTSETPTPESDDAITTITQAPSLTINKTQTGGQSPVTTPGTIDYTITVSNTGNQSLTGVVVSDTLPNGTIGTLSAVSESISANNVLDTNEVWTYTISYEVTQADIDKGTDLVNTAVVTTTELPTPESDTAATPITQAPSLTINKTQTGGQIPVTTPGAIDYTITVSNTGNQSLTGVVVSDTLPNGTIGTLSAVSESISANNVLDTNEVWTYTISYEVTQADIDKGADLVNTAVVTTTELPTPETDTAATPITQAPALTIVKTQTSGQKPVVSPGTLGYEIVVSNTGNQSLTGVVVSDTLPNGTIGTLSAVSESISANNVLDTNEVWTYTISYEVTQADIDNGAELVNTAVVTTTELPTPESDTAATPITQAPSLTINKTQTGGQSPVTTPGTIDYTITVSNTGNQSLTGVVVSDTLPNGTIGTLSAVSESISANNVLDTNEVWTYTISYEVTQADIDKGTDLVNTAVVTTTELPTPESDTAATPITQAPSLTINKTQTGGQNPVTTPGTIDYTITVSNTGNQSLTGVVVSDTLPNGTIGTLSAVSESISANNVLDTNEVWTYTISYEVTQADIDKGTDLVNTAVVTTTELPTPESDTAATPITQAPALTIVKTQTSGQKPVVSPGTLGYEIVVSNTGNQSLTGVVVSDTLPNGTVGTLSAVSESISANNVLDTNEVWTYTISYEVTQADIDKGAELVNTAVVTTTELPTPETDTAATPITQAPALTIVKTQTSGQKPVVSPGTLGYEIVVSNTGNQSLTGVVVSDTLPNGTIGTLSAVSESISANNVLDTNEVWTYTISYEVTQADIDKGTDLVNTAVVTTTELPTPESDTAATPITQAPSLTINKTQTGGQNPVTTPGTIDYTITVSNTGNQSLTGVVVSDTLPNGTIGTLSAVSESISANNVLDTNEVWTYTISYEVTQADIDKGTDLVNTAVVTTTELPTPETDTAATPITQAPSLTINKTQTGGQSPVTTPGTIDYTITVSNTGNQSLTGVVVSDTLPNGTIGTLSAVSESISANNVLDTNEVWTYTISYEVTQADIDKGTDLVNTAVVTTTELPTPESDTAATPITQAPALTIVKTQTSGQKPVVSPGTLGYEIVVSNTGNQSLTGVVVSDTLPNGTIGTLSAVSESISANNVLDTNEVWTYTISYEVTQADIDKGTDLVNTAVVTTTELPTPESDTAATPITQAPSLTINKTQTGGQNPVTTPGTIDYTITVSNTGNQSLTGVVVSDTLPNGTIGTLSAVSESISANNVLDTNEVWTYTISYEVTQADIDKGTDLVNTAVVTTTELPTPETDTAATPITQAPALTIVKTQTSGQKPVVSPGTLGYEIVVSNTGNQSLTGVVVSDTLPNGTVGTLSAVSESISANNVLDTNEVWTYTISYEVTQADIDKGAELVNTAVVTTTELPTPETDTAATPITQAPSLTINKTQTGGQSPVTTPGTIDYTITVSNTGNQSLTGVVVSDTLPNGTIGTLSAVSESISANNVLDTNEVWTYTISYEVTQADIDKGTDLVNTAVVTTTELPTPETDTAATPITQAPSLTINKTQTGGQNPVTTPGTIDYTIVVSNTGNQSLTGVVVSDTLPNGTIGTLSAVSESISANNVLDTNEVWTYTISYEVTQADIDKGTDLVNTAVVTTTELPTPETDTAATPITQAPSLTINKTQTGGQSPVTTPGTIDYTITVSNTGNQSLTGVVVSDTLPNGTIGTLSAVSESISANNVLDTNEVWTYTISYEVTQADIDKGTDLVNTAVVTTTELPTPESDTAATPITQAPALTIVKTQTSGQKPVVSPGTLGYEIVVSNTGNQSLTGVVVSDTLPNGTIGTLSAVSESISANNVLDTNEVWTYTISYEVTQADIDKGTDLVNTAVVTTTELPTPESDTAATPITQAPALTIVKTQTSGQKPVVSPGTLGYEIVVSNTGNQSLTGVVVSDTLPNGTIGTLSAVSESISANNVLDTNEVWTYTISYEVTQADIDKGTDLVNTAVVTTTELPTPETDTAATPITQAPSLTINKTQIGGQSPVTTPGTIDYTITVSNTGNQSLTGVVVSDTLPNGTIGTLSAVSESISANNVLDTNEVWTYTISYEVTQADIDKGTELVNTAVVTTTELPTPESDTAATPITQAPSLTINKTQTGGQIPVTTPGAIDYTITVSNTGNQSLTGVVVSDTLPNGTIGTLSAVSESISANNVLDTNEVWTYTISYEVTQADIDKGAELVNTAVVTTTELPTPETDTAATPITQAPALTIVKTQTSGQKPVVSPGTLGYEIVVSNTGNQSLTGVVVSDTLPNGTVGTLSAVSESISANNVLDTNEVWTYTISYDVTQADIDKGTDLVNTAVVTTTELPTPETDTAATPITQAPSLTINKTQTGGQIPVTTPGAIDYTITVSNTGNQSLTGVVVSDTLPNGTIGTLSAVSESISANNVLDTNEVWTYTISYEVTQADIDKGADLVNTAVVTTTELPTPETDTAATPITQAPALTIVKTQTSGQKPVVSPGTLGYEIVVSNTGNQSLTGVVVSDTLPNGTIGTLSAVSESISANNVLDTNEVWTYTISYEVTQADIDNGAELVNTAVVTTTELPTPESDTAATPITQAPALTIVKTQTSGQKPVVSPGTLGYEIVVSNTGNQSLTGVVVSDTLPNGTVGTLSAVSESISANNVLDTNEVWTYTISYEVTQADIDKGADLVNTAVVTTTELPTPETDTAATPITQAPALTIVKTQTSGQKPVVSPGTLGYEIVVSNTGNQSLTGVVVSDTLPNGTIGTLSAVSESISANNVLDTNEVWTYTISYEVTQADIDKGTELVNTAVVTTTELPTPESDTAATPITQAPSLTINKTQTGGQSPVTTPGTIDYTITVSNTGNQSLTGVVVSDTLPNGTIGTLSAVSESISANNVLDTNEVWTYTISYEVTQADIDKGAELVNTAVVTTTELPTPETDTAATPITQAPALTIVKTQTSGQKPVVSPGTLGYEIVVSNTGNQSLTGVVVSDTLPNGTVGTLSAVSESISANNVLDTNEVWTYTISYDVTQADIDKGTELVNTAVVTTTELPTPETDTAATPITQAPSLTINKTQTGGQIPVTTPGAIDYTITVSNTGNQSLTGVVVSDTLPNGTIGTLSAVSESISANNVLDTNEVWTYTISYEVTQADIDKGADLVNTAVVTTTELPTPETDTAATPITQAPALTIVKTQTSGQKPVVSPGTLGYEIVVSNTGNQSLTGVVVSDTLPNGTIGTLSAVSESISANNVLDTNEVWTYTISYEVTQADIDKGTDLVNTAVVTTTELPTPETDTAATPITQAPALTIVKTQTSGQKPVVSPGTLGYEIVVSNTGNQSLTGVVVSDTLPNGTVGTLSAVSESISANNVLDTNEVWTYTISYEVTQADIDKGTDLVNTAVVTTTELPTPETDTAATPITQAPSLTINKTQIGGQSPVTTPGTIDYTITVSNTGNQSLTGVVVSDTLPNGTIGTLSAVSESISANNVLDTNEVWTYTISYEVTQADIDKGTELVNTAVVTTTELPTPESDTAATPITQAPSLTINKTQTGGQIPVTTPGAIDYTITVSNTGNQSLTGVVVSDTLPNGTIGTLSAVSESISANNVLDTNEVWTYTISYEVTQADIDKGAELVNTAVVTTTELPTPETDTAATPITQAPALTIVKTQTSGQKPVVSPGTLGYEIVVSNTGNQSLTGVVVSDTLPNGTVGTLSAVSESISANNVLDTNEVWTYTISYDVTQADIDKGTDLVNTAVVTTTELPTPETDTAATPITQAPSLTINKTQTGGQIPVTTPGAIDYTITVSNTGNQSLTGVVVSDTLPNGTIGTLSAVSESISANNVLDTNEVWTYTISYEVTQADIDKGTDLVNTAVVTTTELPTPETDTAATPITQAPALTIVKTQTSGQKPVVSPGTLGYEIVVSNTGNQSLTGVVVSDTLPNGTIGTLSAVSESISANNVLDTNEVWTYTISYEVTQADIDNGAELVNTAVVTTTELPTPESDTAATPITQAPSLTINKTQTGGQNPVTTPGTIDYTITVSNTGNQSLTGVVVSDTLPNGTIGTLSAVSESISANNVLDTNEVWTYTISYDVTQADIDKGTELVNTAVVTTTELPTPESDTAATSITQAPALTIVKTQTSGQNPITTPGDIDYSIVVTNTGNTSLTGVVVSDTLPNGTVGTLSAVTESINANGILDTTETWTYSITYAVTQADIDAGEALVNMAVVTTDSLPTPQTDTASTPISLSPSLTLSKTADDTSKVNIGQTVTYTYQVINTGNTTLLNTTISDIHEGYNSLGTITLFSTTGLDDGIDEIVNTLYPGDTAIWTAEYIVAEEDIIAGIDIVNTATAKARTSEGDTLEVSAVETISVAEPPVAVDDSKLKNTKGETVVINLLTNDQVSNGDTATAGLTTVDIDLTTPGIQDTLNVPGEGVYVYNQLTGELTFTPDPLLAAQPSPIEYRLIEDATGLSDDAIVTISYLEIDLSLTKVANQSLAMAGDTIMYTLTLRNDGLDTAYFVGVKDYLPNGLISPMAINSGGTLSGDTITWKGLTVNPGQSINLTYEVVVAIPSSNVRYVNIAEVTETTGYDFDSRPDNIGSTPSEDDEAVYCLQVKQLPSSIEICENSKLVLEVFDGETVTWHLPTNSTLTGDSLVIENISRGLEGWFKATISSTSGCVFTDSVYVTINGLPQIVTEVKTPTCDGANARNDGSIKITPMATGYTYWYSNGVTFDEGNANSATPQTIPANGLIAENLSNVSGGQNITVRVYNPEGCSKDFVINVPEVTCECKPEICIPITLKKLN